MVPKKCDGQCQRVLLIWDLRRTDAGMYLCNDCLIPKEPVPMSLGEQLKYNPLAVQEEIWIPIRPKNEEKYDPGFDEPEPGSEERYGTRLKGRPWLSHTFWWVIHNCVAHFLIGIAPIKSLFKFHDWTSYKMHGLTT